MKAVPKLIQYFLLCMLALTFVSWKLDAARTPLAVSYTHLDVYKRQA